MENSIIRLFVEKKSGFDVEAKDMLNDLRVNLGIDELKNVRILNRYDISGISKEEYEAAKYIIFSEKTCDKVYEEEISVKDDERMFLVEYLPGQYDKRSDAACQCISLLTQREGAEVNFAKVIILEGGISEEEFLKIKDYSINPVDSREASIDKPASLHRAAERPMDVKILNGFIESSEGELRSFMNNTGLAMSFEDLMFTRDYFKNIEKRDPSITEIKVIDTYWSDHCRHTTFNTKITNVEIESGKFSEPIKTAYKSYQDSREFVYTDRKKDMCLMDMAVIGMKELKKLGMIADLDDSEEINACSIEIDVDVDGENQKWLFMFKNETHNHPTEIEPYGGAATCLGGAIRDPLSGRAYVYQAMRVTGSGDPRTKVQDTLEGKLPQRKISLGAAQGYSSYGNQIGLATGQVTELYHEDYRAKRMEIGAVLGAAPKENVIRKVPAPSDVVVLIGGRTGRDGCGGATGSSKEHDEKSILSCGAEVQKGNPIVERKLQRLFRNPEVSKLIKRCNDFGAGGVSVAIGELAEGLNIDLDKVPKKYEGLDGTELAISESQERMAVVIDKKDLDFIISMANAENLEATKVAEVTEDKRLKMSWRDKAIVDISREFLDTNGASQYTDVYVDAPKEDDNYFTSCKHDNNLKKEWLEKLQDINVCSQKGLAERFDSSIGAGTVLMPFGGKYGETPEEGMVAKIPVLKGKTDTVSIMAYGCSPFIGKWSPFHGAVYGIVEAVTKIAALGGDFKKVRLSLQEFFGKPGTDPKRWGKPFAALLGAAYVQKHLGIPAIGGKDSMSGTFKDMDVPPSVTAFAVCTAKAQDIVSSEFKKPGNKIVLIEAKIDENEMPDFEALKANFDKLNKLINEGKVVAARSIRHGGLCEALTKMCFGNRIGIEIKDIDEEKLFKPLYGSVVLEVSEDAAIDESFSILGCTIEDSVIKINGTEIILDEAYKAYESPLEGIFPTKMDETDEGIENVSCDKKFAHRPLIHMPQPKVFIPVFPGTNCEYDLRKAFENAGGKVSELVFRNLNTRDISSSIDEMAREIREAQIIMLPGGFSAADEPEGSGKFIAAIFRNEKIKEATMELLNKRDGLMLGICNGFQALIKLGLVPYGEIRNLDETSPTLTYNKIGRHVSCMIRTKVVSTLSPWLANVSLGDIHTLPISHGEGRFMADEAEIKRLISNGQIAMQYVDFDGNATYDAAHNPNGSYYAVEGITSPDGRIFGKMAHSERTGKDILINVPGEKDQRLFEAGINYFK